MSDVTKQDLTELRTTLSEQMREGFRAITDRLDRLNGRVGSLEQQQARTDTRLTYVEGGGEGRPGLSSRALIALVSALFVALQVLERVVVWALERGAP